MDLLWSANDGVIGNRYRKCYSETKMKKFVSPNTNKGIEAETILKQKDSSMIGSSYAKSPIITK